MWRILERIGEMEAGLFACWLIVTLWSGVCVLIAIDRLTGTVPPPIEPSAITPGEVLAFVTMFIANGLAVHYLFAKVRK